MSNSTILPVRMYAPYIYLTKGNGNFPYILYTAISAPRGSTVNAPSIKNFNGTISVSFEIKVSNTTAPREWHYDSLNIEPVATVPLGSDTKEKGPEATVSVNVSDAQGNTLERREITIICDENADPPLNSNGKIAHGCPYIYLTNPNAEIGSATRHYAPRCHVPLLGQNYDPTVQKPADFQTVKGGCLQEITLFGDSNIINLAEVKPDDISANTQEYEDPGRVNQFFLVTVKKQSPADNTTTTRTAKLPNRSSDTHPNSFIDDHDFVNIYRNGSE